MERLGSFANEGPKAVICGELGKQRGKVFRRVAARHCLVAEGVFAVYDSPKAAKASKAYSLTDLQAALVPGATGSFSVQVGGRSHTFVASSELEAAKWVDVLSQGENEQHSPPAEQPAPISPKQSDKVEVDQPSAQAGEPPAQPSAASGVEAEQAPPHQEESPSPQNGDNNNGDDDDDDDDASRPPAELRRPASRVEMKIEGVYELGDELGKGGFSVVRKGVHKETGEEWALKLIQQSVFHKAKQRMLEEVAMLNGLCHPGIIRLNEVVNTPKFYVIVLELMRGGTLEDRVATLPTYRELEAAHVVRDVLKTLKYLHSGNIVHRDIKPDNLLFDGHGPDARAKLTDFGFATVVDPNDPPTQSLGTPQYVAPEVISNQPYGTQADCWSIGVMVYVLLCGSAPFFGDNEPELYRNICLGKVSFQEPAWEHISPQAKDLVSKLLVVDPNERLTARQALQHEWFKVTTPSNPGADLVAAVEMARQHKLP